MERPPPELPDEYLVRYTTTPQGRMRGRILGEPGDAPPVVAVPGLNEAHRPAWKRAGPGRILHLISVHLRERIEEILPRITSPTLVIRGERDRMSTRRWAAGLAGLPSNGAYLELPGPHTFLWHDPAAWSEPIRRLAARRSVKL